MAGGGGLRALTGVEWCGHAEKSDSREAAVRQHQYIYTTRSHLKIIGFIGCVMLDSVCECACDGSVVRGRSQLGKGY